MVMAANGREGHALACHVKQSHPLSYAITLSYTIIPLPPKHVMHDHLAPTCMRSLGPEAETGPGLVSPELTMALGRFAPATDVLLASISRLDTDYSAKFYAKLYK